VTFYDRALAGVASAPGVTTAAIELPSGPATQFRVEGRPEPRPEEERPDVTAISARYFDTMRIPVRRGRSIAESDRPTSQKAVVLSEGLARHYWGEADPIGQRVQLDKQSGWWTVVGVAADVKHDWFNGVASPEAYIPYTQHPSASSRFRVRAQADPSSIASTMQAQIAQIDKDLPVLEMRPFEALLAEERGGVEAAASAMSTYAIAALLLAVTGVYAVISFFVAARTRDIGVRIALGATPIDVVKLTLRQTMRLVCFGLAIGLPLSWGMAHAASAALFGVVQFGAGTFIVFAGALTLAALLAGFLPASRAAHIDPIAALRAE
jgi:putative ABC transport system permease protein